MKINRIHEPVYSQTVIIDALKLYLNTDLSQKEIWIKVGSPHKFSSFKSMLVQWVRQSGIPFRVRKDRHNWQEIRQQLLEEIEFISYLREGHDGLLACPRCGWIKGQGWHCGLCEGHEENITKFYREYFFNKKNI